jgi:hypothetical protein
MRRKFVSMLVDDQHRARKIAKNALHITLINEVPQPGMVVLGSSDQIDCEASRRCNYFATRLPTPEAGLGIRVLGADDIV